MTLLASQKDFFEITGSSVQTDYAYFGKELEYAQFDELRPCIGQALYDELILQTETDTLTTDNLFLLEHYVRRYLVMTAFANSLSAIWIQTKAKGLQINSDDTSQSADSGQAMKRQMEIQNKADKYKLLMNQYLSENKFKYPLFPSELCEGGCNKTRFQIFLGHQPRY